jgi:hypothetical protein
MNDQPLTQQEIDYLNSQQQPQQYFPPSNPYPQDSKADFLDKIRPEEVVEQTKQRLMGKEFDISSNTWIQNPALKDMAMTEVGACAITNLIFPASTRNVSISNLKDDEIKKRLLSIIRTTMKMCLDNYYAYGIKGEAQLYFIKEVVFTSVLVSLKQPENEGIRRMINSTIQENRSYSNQEEKKGVLGLFRR